MTPAHRTLAAAEARRIASLGSAFPILFIEVTPGAEVDELLGRWADEPQATDLRVIIRADSVSVGAGDLATVLLTWLRSAVPGIVPDLSPAGGAPVSKPPSDPAGAPANVLQPKSATPAQTELAALLSRLRRPLVLAVTGADHLDPAAFADLTAVVARRDTARLIVAGFDCSVLMEMARAARLPYSRLGDLDFALRRDEIAAMLAEEEVSATPAEIARIHRHSRGLPGVVRAAIAYAETTGGEAVTINPGEIGGYLFTTGVQHWPSPLVAFVTTMMHVPRFTMGEAAAIGPAGSVRPMVDRMVMLDLGRISFHPALRQQVFTWFEPARVAALGYLAGAETRAGAESRRRRTIEAARESLDAELLVVTHVADGRLAAAESYLADWLWECLPNGYDPLWEPLLRVDFRALAAHPRLLVLRLRIEPREQPSPAAIHLPAAVGRSTEPAQQPSYRDCWLGLADAALAVEFARLAADTAGVAPAVRRARAILRGAFDAEHLGAVRPGVVCDVLLLAEAVFRLGNHAAAAEFACYAIDLIESGPQRVDPWGERRAVASRMVLVSQRERGLADPPDTERMLAGSQFRWREPDVVAQQLAVSWAAVDDGDLAAAERHTTAAISRVTDALAWPALWYQHLWVLGLSRQRSRAQRAVERYRASCARVGIALGAVDLTPQPLRDVAHVIGDYVPAPDFLVPEGARPGDRSARRPRWEFDALLLDALAALRGDRRSAARELLTSALTVALPRPISPTVLTVAQPEEIRTLGQLVADHPFVAALHLDHALAVAGQVAAGVDLSEREREVLALLRAGMTNRAIAAALFVTVNTAKFHRSNLMRKFGASTRQELLEAAAKAGL